MKHNSAPKVIEPTEREIQHAAYMLWIEEGRPEGRDLKHWLAAKAMLCHRHGRDAETHLIAGHRGGLATRLHSAGI